MALVLVMLLLCVPVVSEEPCFAPLSPGAVTFYSCFVLFCAVLPTVANSSQQTNKQTNSNNKNAVSILIIYCCCGLKQHVISECCYWYLAPGIPSIFFSIYFQIWIRNNQIWIRRMHKLSVPAVPGRTSDIIFDDNHYFLIVTRLGIILFCRVLNLKK